MQLAWLDADFIQILKEKYQQTTSPNPYILQDLEHIKNTLQSIKKYTIPNLAPTNATTPARSNFIKHTFSAIPINPKQQHILNELGRGKDAIIEVKNEEEQDKNKTLVAILTNILANSGRVLVVSKNTDTLQWIQEELNKLGLQDLVWNVNNPEQSYSQIANNIMHRASLQSPKITMSSGLVRLLQSCATQIQQWQQYHLAIQQPLFDTLTYSDIVARCMEAQQKMPKALLDGKLENKYFKYSIEELESMVQLLEEGEQLFKPLGSLQHPFNVLDDRFFKLANIHQVEANIKEAIKDVLYVLDSAQRDVLTYLFQYEKLLDNHFTEVYIHNANLAEELTIKCKEGTKYSKYLVNNKTGLGGKISNLFGGFTGNNQKLEQCQEGVMDLFFKLVKQQTTYYYFTHTFVNIQQEDLTFEAVEKNIAEYLDKLKTWYNERESVITHHLHNLSHTSVHQHIDFKVQVKEILRNLDLFIENLSKSRLFKAPFQFTGQNVRQRLLAMEQLDKNVKQLSGKWTDFPAYHALKYFWSGLNDLQKYVFQIFSQLPNTTDWAKLFESWYWHAILASKETTFIPKQDTYQTLCKTLQADMQAVQSGLLQYIKQHHFGKHTEVVRTFQQSNNIQVSWLYQLVANQADAENLRQAIIQSPKVFTTSYPIILATAEQVSELFPPQTDLFDVVILDDVQALTLEETFSCLVRANYQLLLGMPNAENKLLPTTPTKLPTGISLVGRLAHSISLWDYARVEGSFSKDALWIALEPIRTGKSLLDIIYNELVQSISPKLIARNVSLHGLEFPFAIYNEAGTIVMAIYLDIFRQLVTEEVYLWDMYLEDWAKEQKIELFRTWSYHWWVNAGQERKRLLARFVQ